MKSKEHNKHIKFISQKISELEQEILLGKNIKVNQQKIEDIMSFLPFEEILEIDDYIERKKLLTR